MKHTKFHTILEIIYVLAPPTVVLYISIPCSYSESPVNKWQDKRMRAYICSARSSIKTTSFYQVMQAMQSSAASTGEDPPLNKDLISRSPQPTTKQES